MFLGWRGPHPPMHNLGVDQYGVNMREIDEFLEMLGVINLFSGRGTCFVLELNGHQKRWDPKNGKVWFGESL